MKLNKILNEEYEKVSSKEIAKNKYKETEEVKKLRKVFEEYLSFWTTKSIFDTEERIRIMQEKILAIPFNQKDTTVFSTILGAYTSHKYFNNTGYFLSRLLHAHTKRKETYKEPYLFILEDLPPLSNIGWKIEEQHLIVQGSVKDCAGGESINAHIEIRGNTGDQLAEYSIRSTIIVEGNTETFCGIEMERSYVHVCGKAGSNAGVSMRSGYLIIDNKADSGLGYEMKGGIIIAKKGCNGNIGEYMRGGLIIVEEGIQDTRKIMRYNGKIVYDQK